MAYLYTPKLEFPLKNYKVNSYKFGQHCSYNGVYWGIHLGEDINCKPGIRVRAIGRGKVVYSKLHSGSNKTKNWGNIIIIAHKNPQTKQVFFSLYGHLKMRNVKRGDRVKLGQIIGIIALRNTPENGWWENAHLHFAIYTGIWKGKVLPGYYKKNQRRTKLIYWQNPTQFIKNYNI